MFRETRRCEHCNEKFVARHPSALCCSKSCRVLKALKKKKEKLQALGEAIENSIPPESSQDNVQNTFSEPINPTHLEKTPQGGKIPDSSDAHLSWEKTYGDDYPVTNENISDNKKSDHEDFPEPPPPEVFPITNTKTVRDFTLKSKALIERKAALEKGLFPLSTGKRLFEFIQSKLTPNKIIQHIELPEKEELKSFDELLQGRVDTSKNVKYCIKDGDFAQYIAQEKKIKEKISSYEKLLANAQKIIADIDNKLDYWEAKEYVKRTYVLNEEEYLSYQKKLKDWTERKAGFEQVKQQQIKNEVVQPSNETAGEIKAAEINSPEESVPALKIQQPVKDNTPLSKKLNKKPGVIVNSFDLHNYSQEVINFHGRFEQFLGRPQKNFFMIIHGLPGQGKSNFSLQLAKYISDNHGRILYISGEEGFNYTFAHKIEENGAKSENLDIADCRKLEDILNKVPKTAYNFIAIDSLNNMGIDAEGIKKIRSIFKSAAIIAIQQSTKDGKVRGSMEIVHDCDMEINVINGKAITKKNRFKRTGLIYDIFPETDQDEKDDEII